MLVALAAAAGAKYVIGARDSVTVRADSVAALHLPEVDWLQPQPSGNQINGLATRGSRWVAVGDAGTVTVSSDAGRTWRAFSTLTAEPMRGVGFLDSLHLLAVGAGGVLLASADGGRQWQARRSNTRHELRAVVFTGRTAVVVGARGTVLRSDDGGASWRSHNSGVTATLRGLATLDPNTLITVGDGGTILRSADAGVSWRRVASGTKASLRAVRFVNARLGVAVGGDDLLWRAKRVVLFSSDGGATWRRADAPRGGRLYALAADAKRMVAVGENGAVIATLDAGATWRRVPHEGKMWLGAAALPGAGGIVALGARGAIVRTENAGTVWRSALDGLTGSAAAVAQPAPGTILLGSRDSLFRSGDSGASFAPLRLPDSSGGVWRMDFADEHRGIAVGYRGVMLRSSDGGKTWARMPPLVSKFLQAVDHVQDGTWFVVGQPRYGGPSIFRSTDDGVTWRACACASRGMMQDVHFNGKVGMIVGGNVMVRTTDGGTTWARVHHDLTRVALRGVRVMDATTAIAVGHGGIIIRTVDGGTTWSRIPAGTSETLYALDAIGRTAVAVGMGGTMVVTDDAGLTWRALRVGIAADLWNVSLRTADEAIVTGRPIGAVRVRLRDSTTLSARRVLSEPHE